MPEKLVRISKSGGVPEIEISFGHAQYAKYEIFLWDPNGQNPKLIGAGVNVDQIPDKFPVGTSAAALDKCLISWEAIISAFDSSPGQLYSMTVTFTQDNKNAPDGPFQQTGSLEGVKYAYDFARFKVS